MVRIRFLAHGAGAGPRLRKVWRWCAVAILVPVGVSGCSAERTSEENTVFGQFIAEAIAEASGGGANAQQLELLEEARTAGEVSLELVRTATHAAIQCFLDAGFQAEYIDNTGGEALTTPGYRVWKVGDLSPSEDLAIEQCDIANVAWVNKVYQLQPSSAQVLEEFLNGVEDELRACLEDAGYQTDPNATGVELAQQAGPISVETGAAVDCLDEVRAW